MWGRWVGMFWVIVRVGSGRSGRSRIFCVLFWELFIVCFLVCEWIGYNFLKFRWRCL